jgi:hypothetical protein
MFRILVLIVFLISCLVAFIKADKWPRWKQLTVIFIPTIMLFCFALVLETLN